MKRSAKTRDAAVRRAIARAERLLPGVPAPEGEEDSRWQAILELDRFIESHPELLWQFVLRWGKHPQKDLRMALAVCLLEHLLELTSIWSFHVLRSRRGAAADRVDGVHVRHGGHALG